MDFSWPLNYLFSHFQYFEAETISQTTCDFLMCGYQKSAGLWLLKPVAAKPVSKLATRGESGMGGKQEWHLVLTESCLKIIYRWQLTMISGWFQWHRANDSTDKDLLSVGICTNQKHLRYQWICTCLALVMHKKQQPCKSNCVPHVCRIAVLFFRNMPGPHHIKSNMTQSTNLVEMNYKTSLHQSLRIYQWQKNKSLCNMSVLNHETDVEVGSLKAQLNHD